MDPEKFVSFLVENLADYVSFLFRTLCRPNLPIAAIAPQYATSDSVGPIIGPPTQPAIESRLHPKLVVFVLLSIFLGFALESCVPGRTKLDLTATIVFLISSWIFYGVVTWILCRAMLGRGGFLQTLSISLQYQSVIYFVAGFFAVGLGAIARSTSTVDWTYIVLHSLLFVVYLTLAAGAAHGFRWRKLILGPALMCVALFEVLVILLGREFLHALGKWK